MIDHSSPRKRGITICLRFPFIFCAFVHFVVCFSVGYSLKIMRIEYNLMSSVGLVVMMSGLIIIMLMAHVLCNYTLIYTR